MSSQDYLLDHSYDGIQEYDNPLPGWWKMLFFVTVFIAPFYWLYYHIGVGPSIDDEYKLEMAAYYEEQAKQFEGVEVTERMIWDLMQDSKLLAGMEKRFQSKCATCHAQRGEGDACPNLTDMFAKNGGDLMSIYQTIRAGVPGTEMKDWEQELGPAGVLTMAAYVGSLRGKNVDGGKAPEGTEFTIVEPPAAPAADTPKTDTPKTDAPQDGEKK